MNEEVLFDPEEIKMIPPGEYCCRVLNSELKKASSGNTYINCLIQVIQGSQQGRTVDFMCHIGASDAKFRYDSRRKFARLVSCCGITTSITDPKVLIDKMLLVEIGQSKDKFGDMNNIVGFKKLGR